MLTVYAKCINILYLIYYNSQFLAWRRVYAEDGMINSHSIEKKRTWSTHSFKFTHAKRIEMFSTLTQKKIEKRDERVCAALVSEYVCTRIVYINVPCCSALGSYDEI